MKKKIGCGKDIGLCPFACGERTGIDIMGEELIMFCKECEVQKAQEVRMKKKERKLFEKKRKIVIRELEKIEKKYGGELFRSAINRKITVDRQTKQRESEIKRAEKELEQLKKGKPLTQY